jgi:hypothetical protein
LWVSYSIEKGKIMERDPKDVKIVCGLFVGVAALTVVMIVVAIGAIWLFGGDSEDRIAEQRDLAAQERGGQDDQTGEAPPGIVFTPTPDRALLEQNAHLFAQALLESNWDSLRSLVDTAYFPIGVLESKETFNQHLRGQRATLVRDIGDLQAVRDVYLITHKDQIYLMVVWQTDKYDSITVRWSVAQDKWSLPNTFSVQPYQIQWTQEDMEEFE